LFIYKNTYNSTLQEWVTIITIIITTTIITTTVIDSAKHRSSIDSTSN